MTEREEFVEAERRWTKRLSVAYAVGAFLLIVVARITGRSR